MADTVAPREDRVVIALGAMALAATFFTLTDTSAKWLVLAGIPAIQVVFARYAMQFTLAVVAFVPKEGLSSFRSRSPLLQVVRSMSLFAGTTLNFIALKYLPLTVTTTIMFAGPIVVTLLAIPVLGENVGRHRIGAVFVGFIGVVVVIQPWGAAFHPAMVLSIASLIFASIYFLMTRMLAGIERTSTSQLWTGGLATLCLIPFVTTFWIWPDTAAEWAFFCLVGLFAGTGHILATSAHRMAEASVLAPVVYIQIILAAVVGVVMFNTYPTLWTLIGGAIIICSGIYIWYRERKRR